MTGSEPVIDVLTRLLVPLALVAGLLLAVACGGDDEATPGETPPPGPTSSADPVTLGRQVFAGSVCIVCHTVEGISVSRLGPELNHIGTVAATRKPGLSAEAYIRESILDPSAFIVDGFQDLMPPRLADTMSPEEFEALIAFQLSLR